MLEIAPLIHSRTRQCDFVPHFAVRPDDFDPDDTQWANEKILSATDNIDRLNDGIRWLVFSKGEKRVAGIVCFLKNLVNRSNLSENNMKEDSILLSDIAGRPLFAFVGYSIKGTSENKIPDINYDMLWETFRSNMLPVWERKVIETQIKGYAQANEKSTVSISDVKYTKVNELSLYGMSVATDKMLFDAFLSDAMKKDIAFCSCVNDIRIIRKNKFNAFSTSGNVIDRIQSENQTIKNNVTAQVNIHDKNNTEQDKEKKKNLGCLTMVMGCSVITLFILLLVLVK